MSDLAAAADPVLGDDALSAVAAVIGRFSHVASPGHDPYPEALALAVLDTLAPRVAALMAAARAGGERSAMSYCAGALTAQLGRSDITHDDLLDLAAGWFS